MTQEEKLRSIIISAEHLGPVGLYWGVTNGKCDCRHAAGPFDYFDRKKNKQVKGEHTPGKHPMDDAWQSKATSDPDELQEDFKEFPNANPALVTGVLVVALDLDLHPPKDGIEHMRRLEKESGETLPPTPTTRSGSGGLHRLFKVPANIERYQPPKAWKENGIDFQRNGSAVILPGSKNLLGEYTWLPGLAPDEVALAEMPGWLLDLMRLPEGAAASKYSLASSSPATIALMFAELLEEGPPDGSMAPGRLRPDQVVTNKMKGVPMRKCPTDRSFSDRFYAWTLARNCSHHWKQYLRIWRGSPIRQLPDSKCGRPSYEQSILRKAFAGQRQQWGNKGKPLASANPKLSKHMARQHLERPRSALNLRILEFNNLSPELSDAEIAKGLTISGLYGAVSRDTVKHTRQRYPHLWTNKHE